MANTAQKTKTAKNQTLPLGKLSLACFLALIVLAGAINFRPQIAQADSASLSPNGIGDYDAWTANTGDKVNAVATNDGDASYISSTSTTGDMETFSFPGAAVPSGATVNSVTLGVIAKAIGTQSADLRLVAENTSKSAYDVNLGDLIDTSYSTTTWDMATNPITGAAWSVSDANSWAMDFGVQTSVFNSEVRVTQIYLAVNYTPPPAPNPSLDSQICGLDIALVLDNSGSIGGNLPAMKTAFDNFVGSLTPGTPTDFSVTYFNQSATTLQNFSGNAGTVTTAINNVPAASGQTNWQDGLTKAAATFDPRPGANHPNIIIFASDGQPNRYYDSSHTLQGVGGTVDPNALSAAVTEANLIKASGTRIITLGIGGSSVVQANMVDISSSDAYYSVTNFSSLAGILSSIANQMCGGTITVTKKIDADGNLATTNDQTNGGAGFTFDISPNYAGQITDSSGQTSAVAVTAGTYSVTESNIPSGYTALGGSCSGATNNGAASGTAVSGLQISLNNIVSCNFYNAPVSNGGGGGGGGGNGGSTSTDISIAKTVDNSAPNAGDTVNFSLVVTNHGPQDATGVTASDTLPSGLTFVSSTSTVGSYNAATSLWTIGNLADGISATTTITATVASGTASQILTNTATATSTTPDPNSGNNSSSASVSVNSSNSGGGGGGSPSADLTLSKTVNNSTPNPGDTIIYTLVINNLGPDDATGVMATDTLPSAVTFVSSTSTVGSYDATTSLWTIGNLADGASATTTITAIVNPSAAGQSITNSASVGAITVDPNLSNNSSSAGSTVSNPGGGGSTSGGGCSGNCGGGGAISNGGGGDGGGGSNLPIPAQGQVLSTSTFASLMMPTAMPQVLGAATQLPRTGLPVGPTLIIASAVYFLLEKKLRLS